MSLVVAPAEITAYGVPYIITTDANRPGIVHFRGVWNTTAFRSRHQLFSTDPDGSPRPYDLTNRTLRLQVRTAADAPAALLDLTEANGGIIVHDRDLADIELWATPGQISALPAGRYVHDLVADHDVNPQIVWVGSFPIFQGVTR